MLHNFVPNRFKRPASLPKNPVTLLPAKPQIRFDLYYTSFLREKASHYALPAVFLNTRAKMPKQFSFITKKSRPVSSSFHCVWVIPDYPLTFSLNALPALKTGVSLAANSMASPVAGLRP